MFEPCPIIMIIVIIKIIIIKTLHLCFRMKPVKDDK